MGDPAEPPGKPDKPSPEEQEARWQQMMEAVTEQPRNPEVLIRAAALAEELGRKAEAFLYYQKVLNVDPTKSFVIPRMRRVAVSPEQQKEVETLARRPNSFSKALDDVFAYPVRGSGIGILILGAVFFYGCRLIIKFNIFPVIPWLIAAVTGAYLAMFYVDVVTTTVTGSEDLPEWPDPVRFREFFLDWAKIGMAYTIAFLPVIVLAVILFFSVMPGASDFEEKESFGRGLPIGFIEEPRDHPVVEEPRPDPGAAPRTVTTGGPVRAAVPPAGPSAGLIAAFIVPMVIFGLLGFLYLPMGMLANCIYGHPLACINPFFVIRSMGVSRKNYAICILAYFAVAVAAGVLEVLANLPGIFFFSSPLAMLVEIYGGVVQMRILGIFYRMNQAKLGWMSD